MPEFPTYHGELPKCLNSLNLHHYFLLAYWIYFRPTALKCYLYQADPDLYRTGPGAGIFQTLRVPAYRSLYLMTPGIVILLSVLVGLPAVLMTSWIQGTSIDWLNVTFSMVIGMIGGLVFGIGCVVVFGITVGVAFGVAVGVAFSVVFGLVGSVGFGIGLSMGFGAGFGTVVGVMVGVAGGVVVGVAGGVAVAVAVILMGCILFSIAIGWVGGVSFGTGALRVIFYLFQAIPASRSVFREAAHPLEQDELTVLPLPGTRQALTLRLQQNEQNGIRFLAHVAHNPFQRWAVQVVLQSYSHEQPSPIRWIYTLLTCLDLGTYIFAPVTQEDWKKIPSIRRLLFGELDGRWVDCSSDPTNRWAERLVWRLTRSLRSQRRTPLTRFAGMHYELLDEETITADNFDLSAYAEIYTGLTNYPGGEEIAYTFVAMASFLSYDNLLTLSTAADHNLLSLHADPPIRPTVLTALGQLGQVGEEIATYRDATSRVSQLAALARATDALDNLDEYVVAEVMAPEKTILRRIIRQWRRLVSEAGGEVGRAEEIGPIANPYVAGNPVTGDLFVGREDVLRRLEELWSGTGQKPSVVIYGHRRMGKSSILHNLGARFGPRTVVVDFNMQRVGLVASTGELLYNLALALYDAQSPESLDEPDEERFTAHNPYTAFDRFLRQLDRVRADHRFIVTLDEFELIEALIADDKLEPRLLDFWRGLIQTYPWFVMAFAGLHTLQEMTRDYWNPLFGSVIGIPVSFLSHAAAWRLITQPLPDFSLDYDHDAVERIIGLTYGQPYLVQLIGHGLVTRFNRQTFEQGVERERRFSLADIEAVINAAEFYRDGDAYFTGVWRQAETSEPSGQTAVLRALARTETGMSTEEIIHHIGLAPEDVGDALETLARHDVVMEEDGRWKFTVELMRRWVMQKQSRE